MAMTELSLPFNTEDNNTLTIAVKGLPDATKWLDTANRDLSNLLNTASHDFSTAVHKISTAMYASGIMALGIICFLWAKNRWEKPETSTGWQQKVFNTFLTVSGLGFTLGAPLIAAKIQQFTPS